VVAGRNHNGRDPVASDPAMTLIPSTDHYVAAEGATFPTASFMDVQSGVQVRKVYSYIASTLHLLLSVQCNA